MNPGHPWKRICAGENDEASSEWKNGSWEFGVEIQFGPDVCVGDQSVLLQMSRIVLFCFLRFPTTLVDLFVNEPMLHLSHVKQMYSQRIHLAH